MVFCALRPRLLPFSSSSHNASFNIFSVGLDGIQKIRFVGLLSAEENHRIVMKPAPIMEAGKEERQMSKTRLRGRYSGGSRANEEERLAVNAETIRLLGCGWKRVLVERSLRDGDSQRRRDHDEECGGAKEKRRDEQRGRGEGRE